MPKTKDNRAAEIRAALQSAEADLDAARSALGTAVADDDTEAASAAREEVARLERLSSELHGALPIAEQRAREAAEREAEQRQAEANKAANATRKKRIAAARKVDAAMQALGRAFDDYTATDTGGTSEDRNVLARRARAALQAALAHHALPVARALGVESIPRTAHRGPLAESEEKCIRELPE